MYEKGGKEQRKRRKEEKRSIIATRSRKDRLEKNWKVMVEEVKVRLNSCTNAIEGKETINEMHPSSGIDRQGRTEKKPRASPLPRLYHLCPCVSFVKSIASICN